MALNLGGACSHACITTRIEMLTKSTLLARWAGYLAMEAEEGKAASLQRTAAHREAHNGTISDLPSGTHQLYAKPQRLCVCSPPWFPSTLLLCPNHFILGGHQRRWHGVAHLRQEQGARQQAAGSPHTPFPSRAVFAPCPCRLLPSSHSAVRGGGLF